MVLFYFFIIKLICLNNLSIKFFFEAEMMVNFTFRQFVLFIKKIFYYYNENVMFYLNYINILEI